MTSPEQRVRLDNARATYRYTLMEAFKACPEFHGKMFAPKKDMERPNPWENYIPMSFSCTLLDLADGPEQLLYYWSPEP
jgi:hypothetical protein